MDRRHLARFLEHRHLRNTAGRRTILGEIVSLGERHFSAEELVDRFRKRGDRVSRATVYRTLEQLVRGGAIRRLSLGHKHALFESSLGRRHEHLICRRCGGVFPFPSGPLEKVLERACKRRGFLLERRSLQLSGTCSRCQEASDDST